MLRYSFLAAMVCLLTSSTFAPADQVRGVVTKVDPQTGQIVIEARGIGVRGTVLTFTLGKDAPVTFIGNKPADLKDIPVGKNVQISYETQDGKRIALGVRITALKPGELGAGLGGNLLPSIGGGAAPKMEAAGLTGKLRRVAYTEREIVLAMGSGDNETYVSLPVADDAKITRDDKAIKFDDLKEDEVAVVTTAMKDNRKVAVAVQTGKVSAAPVAAAAGDETSTVTRIRQILKIADVILELAEKNEKK